MGTSYAVAVFSAMAIVCQAFTTPTISESTRTTRKEDIKVSTLPTIGSTSQLLTTLATGYSTTIDRVSTKAVTESEGVGTSTVATTSRSETSTQGGTSEDLPSTTSVPVVPERSYPARTPSRLDERLEALDCDIPLLPAESRLWRGNETHELMLPITVSSIIYYFM